jgi:hypothetical protein
MSEPRHEAILEITCGKPGDPQHGEQLLVRAARDLTGKTQGTYIKGRRGGQWEGRDEDGFVTATEYLAKTSPRCPRCRANPRITAANLDSWLDAMVRQSGGEPTRLRVDFRRLEGI